MSILAQTPLLAGEAVAASPRRAASPPRVAELFRQYEEAVWMRTHQFFSWLLIAQWAFCLFIAGVWSPRSWEGEHATPHPHLLAAALFGALFTLPAIFLIQRLPTHWLTRQVVAVAQIGFSLLLIDLANGRIESHFHIFGSLAFLALYRDWRVLPTVTLVVVVHHLLGGLYFPLAAFGVPFTTVWRTIEHTGWIGFEDAVLIWACLVSRREMAEICRREDENECLLSRHLQLIADLPIGLFEITWEGRVRLANPRLRTILGLPMESSVAEFSLPAGGILSTADRKQFWDRLQSEKEVRGFETSYTRPDGQVVTLLINAHLKINPRAAPSAEGTVEDVTENKRARRELESVHQQLVVASRQAGMADVATGVLHNVGNVLTSVNLIVHDVQDRLRSSRISHLRGVVAMLQLEKNRLPVYFGSESGQALPGFLQRLDQQLDTENKKLRADVETLVGHFGHIREIIVMQQNSARLFGVTETLAASELVQDAVTVNIDSLRRHEVDLRRLMDEVPPVRADRHKVLQILVNLIKNAKDSVVASRAAGRQICLRIALQDEKTVAIAVEDNGAGIAPEVVGKIFQHGFTTKKDGHGFGLHSSVLAAREMSGDLTATSTGPAGGARFTLTLPIAGVQPL